LKEILFSAELPASAVYSQGIKVGNTIYLSGIVAFDPATKKVEARTIEEQTERAIRNCESILKSGGSSLEDAVQVIVLLKNPQDFDSMNKAYSKIFPLSSARIFMKRYTNFATGIADRDILEYSINHI
jgi:enamine deaminase RidA (YjgF/YER057c/UK114 family)